MLGCHLGPTRLASAAGLAAHRSLHWQSFHLGASYALTNAAHSFTPPGAHQHLHSHTHDLLFRPADQVLATCCSSLLLHSLRTHKSHLHSLSERQQESAPGIKAALPKPILNARERVNGYLRESLLLSYTALFDNVIFRVFELLRLDMILKWLTPHLEDGYATVTGVGSMCLLLLTTTKLSKPQCSHWSVQAIVTGHSYTVAICVARQLRLNPLSSMPLSEWQESTGLCNLCLSCRQLVQACKWASPFNLSC